MNPQETTSVGSSVVLYLLGIAATTLVTKGILTQDQANALVPEIAVVVIGVASAGLVYWKKTQHSPAALGSAIGSTAAVAAANGATLPAALAAPLIAAVNSDAVLGVKVVSDMSPSPQVGMDPKGNVTRPDPVASKP